MPNKSLLLDALTNNRPPRMARVNRPRKPGVIAALGRLLLGHPGADEQVIGRIVPANSVNPEEGENRNDQRRAA